MQPGRLEESVLSGVRYVVMPPAQKPILETTYHNPAHDASDSNWASALCANNTFPADDPPRYEWTQVLDPGSEFETDLVGLSGTAIVPHAGTPTAGISDRDVWFTHPFGFDWEFFVVPDQQYLTTLAPSNSSMTGEYGDAITHATNDLGINASAGVLGVETDQDLVPPAYRVEDGDRVAVFGRWTVDCGHPDFHTEIHPPLLIATARAQNLTEPDGSTGPLDATYCSLVARPFLVSQEFGDGALRSHLLKEIGKAEIPVPFVGSLQVEAHPRLMPKPFDGVFLIPLTVRPPTARNSPSDRLVVTYHFTVRTGVVVQVMQGDEDSLGLLISMNSVPYSPPPVPTKNDWTISLAEIKAANNQAGEVIDAIGIINLLLNPIADVVLSRGVLTDRYDTPDPNDPHNEDSTREYVDQVSGNSNLSIDDQQVFPLRGWIRVEWERHSNRVPAGSTLGATRVARSTVP
jgi:hypothetical protein